MAQKIAPELRDDAQGVLPERLQNFDVTLFFM
jgi:hypothetical protein